MAEFSKPTLATQDPTKSETIGFHSSFLAQATYDPPSYTLTVDFKSGHQLIYKYVFPTIWQQWKEAPSKGAHYSTQIKGKHESISLRKPLLVSDYDKARKDANRNKAKRN